jgi:hypothetical protein
MNFRGVFVLVNFRLSFHRYSTVLTRGLQNENQISIGGVCCFISHIVHNLKLANVSFDHKPSACGGHDWMIRGLPILPSKFAAEGWKAVLEFLRKAAAAAVAAEIMVFVALCCFHSPAFFLHLLICLQVECRLFDPKALFMSWDSAFIAVGSKTIGIAKNRDKALVGTLSHVVAVAEVEERISIPLAVCEVRAVPEHAGRKHVMAVSVSSTSSVAAPVCICSFDNSATRDEFIGKVQVRDSVTDLASNISSMS